MKKVLILTAGFGEGHNAAARGLKAAFDQEYSQDQVHAEMIDLVDRGYPGTANTAKKAYGKIISHTPQLWSWIYNLIDSSDMVRRKLVVADNMISAMRELLDEKQPDVIVSTYPAYAHQLEELRKRNPQVETYQVPYVKVVTDSITINRVWIGNVAHEFIVPNVETGDRLVELGVDRAKINPIGFPVNPGFATAERDREPLQHGEPAKILFMLNTEKSDYVDLARRLCAREDLRLTVTVGKKAGLREKVESNLKDTRYPPEILGWVDDIPALMKSHHVLIGKAGGATVQEAIAAKLPMIVAEALPGQEEGNALLLETKKVGVNPGSMDRIPELLFEMRQDRGAMWNQWLENLEKISTPDAAVRLAKHIVDTY
jgi:UDP-N-acetylglucosamine:LPS N-acetylglucosamine transferase